MYNSKELSTLGWIFNYEMNLGMKKMQMKNIILIIKIMIEMIKTVGHNTNINIKIYITFSVVNKLNFLLTNKRLSL